MKSRRSGQVFSPWSRTDEERVSARRKGAVERISLRELDRMMREIPRGR